jgi:imidazolonepropionase-like amidohydrolase
MKRLLVGGCLAVLAGAGLARDGAAQDLVITNARILDGAGRVIDRGSVVVRAGKIASVSPGTGGAGGARVIDAGGRTVMPGFIDAHRHLMRGNAEQWLNEQAPARMQEFLDAGFTTVLSAIDQRDVILELRRRLQRGDIKGPRLFSAAIIPLVRPGGAPPQGDPARFDASRGPRQPIDPARAIPRDEIVKQVQAVADAGFDYIKTVIVATPGGPEKDTLRLLVEEGRKRNIPTITHAVSVEDTLAAVEAGPAVLVHTPHIGRLEENPSAVRKIAGAGIPMTSTLAVFVPHFNPDGEPLFRDALPFPWNTISSAGQGPVNARLLWNAGISYGFGTDTSWPPRESLSDELRALQLTFSPKDIVSILTKNAAASVLKADQLGTLEAGKIADIVMLEGDPLADVSRLLNVAMVIKDGRVVVDRSAR